MIFVTDFADQAVALPMVLAMAVLLTVQGWPRAGLAWLASAGGTFGLMLVLKLLFLGCETVFASTGIVSPSGHTASAGLVVGGLAALFVASRLLVVTAGGLAAIGIGYTRVALGLHTPAEVILGGCVGLGGALALSLIAGPPREFRPLPIVIVLGVITIAMHGRRLPAEDAIRQTANLVRHFVPSCQSTYFKRSDILPRILGPRPVA